MPDIAATAGTDDMTYAKRHRSPPAAATASLPARRRLVMRWLVRLAALYRGVLVFLIGYILVNGIPNLKPVPVRVDL